MRNRLIQIASLLALVAVTAYGPATARLAGAVETAPSLSSIGPLAFGPDGMLYVSAGEGASSGTTDYGQLGGPANPCGDPPSPVGGPATSTSARCSTASSTWSRGASPGG